MVPLIWTGSRTKQFMYLIYKRLEEEIGSFDPDFIFVETSYCADSDGLALGT